MSIEQENLNGKVILEVGSGRGNTSRVLVGLLSQYEGSHLIISDKSDSFFSELKTEFLENSQQIDFKRTPAQELLGISNNSIDYIVCNYTLCAINSQSGQLIQAIKRFWEVMKVGGTLFIEEEFPIDNHDSFAEEIWAKKWRILKSAILLADKLPFQEISPETLESLCLARGFREIKWTSHSDFLPGDESLEFFYKRLNNILSSITNKNLKTGFIESAVSLQENAKKVGGMQIPWYQFSAQKSCLSQNIFKSYK